MNHNTHPSPPYKATYTAVSLPKAALAIGGLGAIVGGSAAAAKNIRRVKTEAVNREEAVKDVFKEAAGAGLATAAAAAIVGTLGIRSGLVSVLGMLTVATGTKFAWDCLMAPKTAPAAVAESERPEERPEKKKKEKK